MSHARSRRLRAVFAAAAAAVALLVPLPAGAQYFGQNKVQYRDFDFKVLKTKNFDIYYYPEEEAAVEQAGRLAERWYARFSRLLNHRFARRQPVILYASHPHFEQTNVLQGFIGEGTGGVTEVLKRSTGLTEPRIDASALAPTPSQPRLMPAPPLEWTELSTMPLPVPVATCTP